MTKPISASERSPSEPRPYGRRAFLGLLGAGLTSFWWAGPASRILSPLSSQFSQLSADVLPVGGWRIYTITGTMPDLDASSWTLEVGGLVKKPQKFTLADLRQLPQAKQVSTFHCVTGWTVKNVRWGGVRFHDILAAVEPLPDAHAIQFISAEQPYTDSLTIDQALLPTTMLAYEMDGSPLSRPHGAPARVVIPAMYGYKGVKWLVRMELVAKQPEGYWEQLGYDQNAWVGRSNGY